MKKTFSILLILSWLLFQYSRLLNYQRCPITLLSSIQQVACDCQKQSPEATSGDKQHNTESSAYKFRPDEVFMAFALPSPSDPVSLLLPGKFSGVSTIAAGSITPIFQPPRGNVFLPLFI
ncbi:MAG: hypothetical protein BGO55_02220 [Sphingobacteriales bacterium 50-39]|nr:hypothetical protein [Sphingobacteriales bacterium]OJW55384.1 MAG: hypothetical protein BGO55_02220 [Sphingobacteriales bacterium 50-39]